MSYRSIPVAERHHIPPWDTIVSGYDAGSIGQHFLQRYVPELFKDPDHQRIGEVCRAIDDLLRDVNEYGAAQVRFRFLCPRRCAIYPVEVDGKHDTLIGSYYECRFCKATTPGGPDDINHEGTCALLMADKEKWIVTDRVTIVSR